MGFLLAMNLKAWNIGLFELRTVGILGNRQNTCFPILKY